MLNEEFYDLVDKLALINEDAEEKPVKAVSVEELEKASNEEKPKEGETKEGEAKETKETETDDGENISKAVKDAIKPQVDVASSIINSLKDAYADNCNNSKELSVMTDQIKNWEKTIRGACQTIVDTVKNKKLFSMILYGPPGIGKTSIANALVNDLDIREEFLCQYLD